MSKTKTRRKKAAPTSQEMALEQKLEKICHRSANVLDDVSELERQMKFILDNPLTPKNKPKLKKKLEAARPEVEKYANTALQEFRALRDAIKGNNIHTAVRHALFGMQHAMQAAHGLLKPLTDDGRNQLAKSIEGGEGKKTSSALIDAWIKEAKDYRRRHKIASTDSIVSHVLKEVGGKRRTVTRYILHI